MKTLAFAAAAAVAIAALRSEPLPAAEPAPPEVLRGLGFLTERQGRDGGFGLNDGQDPDVANTAIAGLAFVQSGHTPASGDHRAAVKKALEFVLRAVEAAPDEGPRVTDRTGTQPQNKVGPLVDTFLAGMFLGEVDGRTGDPALDERVRAALEKCVRKTERSQEPDGSWNAGGWAPVLGTAFAQQCLTIAESRGVQVDRERLDKAKEYATRVQQEGAQSRPEGAGVELYSNNASIGILGAAVGGGEASAAQKDAFAAGAKRLGDESMLRGFGSNGGEEYVSFMMASTSLAQADGQAYVQWDRNIRGKLAELQNADGSWAGHHCITGRVFCTSSAILTLTAERKADAPTVAKSSGGDAK